MNQGYEHNMSSTTCAREWDLVKADLANYQTGPDGFEVYGFTGYGMSKSKMYAAETLDELADILGYEGEAKQALLDEIAHYNEMCAAGADTDFDMPGSMMMTIDQPPFYATKEFADGLCTTGGLIVDTECRVLDKDRQPIEGLFAAGIVSGGMFYNTYPHHLNCLSHTRNCLMGYTIGQVLGAKQ